MGSVTWEITLVLNIAALIGIGGFWLRTEWRLKELEKQISNNKSVSQDEVKLRITQEDKEYEISLKNFDKLEARVLELERKS